MRWDIEKSYNTFKHKLFEQRAWASTITAKSMQANFICLTVNLSVLMNQKMRDDEVVDNRDIRRQEERVEKQTAEAKEEGYEVNPLLRRILRATELPQNFYRWLRSFMFVEVNWEHAVARLMALMKIF